MIADIRDKQTGTSILLGLCVETIAKGTGINHHNLGTVPRILQPELGSHKPKTIAHNTIVIYVTSVLQEESEETTFLR